jgi:hypothetical protein
MNLLWIPTIIWFVGLIVLASPRILRIMIKRTNRKLERKAKQVKNVDDTQSTYYLMEEKILKQIRHKNLCFTASITGAFIFTVGFVALGYILIIYT